MYTLTRLSDDLTMSYPQVRFVIWVEGTEALKELALKPELGASCMLGPFDRTYTWMTTDITGILEERYNKEGEIRYLHFNTKNSNYILTWSEE